MGAEIFARGGSLCEGTWGQYLCVQGGDAVSGVGAEDRKTRLVHWWVLRVMRPGQNPWDPTELFVHRDPGNK